MSVDHILTHAPQQGGCARFYGDVALRAACSANDAVVVCGALRHRRRWRRVGLSRPPTQRLLERLVDVRWPAGEQTVRLEVTLVFRDRHLVALAVDYPWDEGDTRVRIAELVLLDARCDPVALGQALLHELLGARRLYAVRSPRAGMLAKVWPEAPALVVEGESWQHVSRVDYRPEPGRLGAEPLPISAADRRALSALGVGGWPASKRPRVRLDTPIELINPADAHAELLRGSPRWRRRFYPEEDGVEDVEVLIVGAGLSGLASAYELGGHRCIVLERAQVIGGTGAAVRTPRGQLGLGAHYECDPGAGWDQRLLDLYRALGLIDSRVHGGVHRFLDAQHYVDPIRTEQAILPDGQLRRASWMLFDEDPRARRLRDALVSIDASFTMPSRCSSPAAKALDRSSFRHWLDQQGLPRDGELVRSLDVGIRSDYGAGAAGVSAFAGIHYFANRAYLTSDVGTFCPPQGLAYFAERLVQCTPASEVRTGEMVRQLTGRKDWVEVISLVRQTHQTRRYRARAVVFAAPKKAIKYIYPPDRALFEPRADAAWMTVTFFMRAFDEQELLCWSNHVAEPTGEHVGFTWVNHAEPQAPPVLAHYIALGPGRHNHARLWWRSPQAAARRCQVLMERLLGRSLNGLVEHVIVNKMGHAMPTPAPGRLFIEPNARRACPRIIYAGVDTGRLPLLAEAFDAGLEAADRVREVLDAPRRPLTRPCGPSRPR